MGVGETLRKVVLREAKRNNEVYRPHAFRCLWRVAAVREDLDWVGEIAEIVGEYLVVDDGEDEDAMDVDGPPMGKGRGGSLDLKSRTTWAAVEAVVRGYNRAKMRKSPMVVLGEVVLALESAAGQGTGLNAQSPYVARPEFATIRRIHWYDCVREVLEEAVGEVATSNGDKAALGGARDVVEWFVNTLDLDTEDTGTEEQRLARAKAVKATIRLGKTHAGLLTDNEWKSELADALGRVLGKERSLEVQKAWREGLELLK
jgi:proteasome component ECM29